MQINLRRKKKNIKELTTISNFLKKVGTKINYVNTWLNTYFE